MRRRSFALVMALLGSACVLWPEGTGPEAGPMPLEEAIALQAKGQAVIVDVRSPSAYAAGHIPGALSLPASEVDGRAGELRRLGRLPILYCG